jgi:hypothetical protein
MINDERFIRQQAFDVFTTAPRQTIFGTETGERKIDTVFYVEAPRMTCEDVRESLIRYDGYSADIIVRKAKKVK